MQSFLRYSPWLKHRADLSCFAGYGTMFGEDDTLRHQETVPVLVDTADSKRLFSSLSFELGNMVQRDER